MNITDINDAYAMRINPVGAAAQGGDQYAGSTMLRAPAVQSNEHVMVLLPMTQTPSTVPMFPDTAMGGEARQASAQHAVYVPQRAAYLDGGQMAPPAAPPAPGYFDKMAVRRNDLPRVAALAAMVTLGQGVHWVATHYLGEWLASSDFDFKQRLLIRLAYPAAVLFAIWNLKALQ
jgi:hypothetical protein